MDSSPGPFSRRKNGRKNFVRAIHELPKLEHVNSSEGPRQAELAVKGDGKEKISSSKGPTMINMIRDIMIGRI